MLKNWRFRARESEAENIPLASRNVRYWRRADIDSHDGHFL
jgi:hypothetical protein